MSVKKAFLSRLLASSDTFSEEQVVQTINLLVEYAIEHAASDIHIEPHERFVQVRYRIDNVLRGTHKLPLAALPAVTAQIKELCHLKTDIDHLPQEGQYATLVGEEQFEVQVNILPVVGGEKIVMHIFRRLNQPPSLVALGFWGDSLDALRQTISANHGLIVVATPRRQGKSTTLHSLLQTIHNPAISIATVEDSLDYRLEGVNQTLVQPRHGITIASGLQATLGQDPNVIMVSNITDKPSFNTAVQAAISGHLVIIGLHASSAAAALNQLHLMSDEPFLFAHAIRAAVSQRLVRRLCSSCRQSYTPTTDERQSIEKAFAIGNPQGRQWVHHLEQRAVQAGIGGKDLASTPQGIGRLWRAAVDGCQDCNHSGYRGFVAITEVLTTTNSEVQATLLASSSVDKIRRAALKNNYIPMELDGLTKALRGQTTIAELLRSLTG